MRDIEGTGKKYEETRERGAGRKCREGSVMPHTQMRERGTEKNITVQGFGNAIKKTQIESEKGRPGNIVTAVTV